MTFEIYKKTLIVGRVTIKYYLNGSNLVLILLYTHRY